VKNLSDCYAKVPSLSGEAFIQLRVLNVQSFVKYLRPNSIFDITMTIKDNIILDNDGVWNICSNGHEIFAKKDSVTSNNLSVEINDFVKFMEDKNLIKPFITQFIDEY
jgi:predicted acetyltransferase